MTGQGHSHGSAYNHPLGSQAQPIRMSFPPTKRALLQTEIVTKPFCGGKQILIGWAWLRSWWAGGCLYFCSVYTAEVRSFHTP